ncbi:MAG: hypothetical protein HY538_04695 [Deltaproteobacteria bacterium]|nr:hypothetical protein [Deltaproteobacteria bacterium]
MRWRKIDPKKVEESIRNPDAVERSTEGKMGVWLKTSDGFLKTTYVEENDEFFIITAVMKKRPPKEVKLL